MTCSSIGHACVPRRFDLFQPCDPAPIKPGCPTDAWKVSNDSTLTRIKLDNGYSLELDSASSKVVVLTPEGRRLLIGENDPQGRLTPAPAGSLDFSNTTTFQLRDGTRITLNADRPDNIVVTKDDKALIVNGLGQANRKEPLEIIRGTNGKALDDAVWDGRTKAYEAANGAWLREPGGQVWTQATLDNRVFPAVEVDTATLDEQRALIKPCPPPSKAGYCFTWLEALAAAFGNVLTKQVDKINWIYQNLNACYAVKKGCELSPEDYARYCDAYKGMTGKDVSGWTSKEVDGKTVWSPSDDAAAEADKGQIYWQQVLTGASQQFTISAQTGMTVQNAISQGMQTVARLS